MENESSWVCGGEDATMLRRAVNWGARQLHCAPRGAFVGGRAASLPAAAGGLRALRCDEEGCALRGTDMSGRYRAGAV